MFLRDKKTYFLAHVGDKKPLKYYVNKVSRQNIMISTIRPHKDSVKALKIPSKYQSAILGKQGMLPVKPSPFLLVGGIPQAPPKVAFATLFKSGFISFIVNI